MNYKDIKKSGIIIFDASSFEKVLKGAYKGILHQLLDEIPFDYSKAENFILEFYEVFENSKKMLIFEQDNK